MDIKRLLKRASAGKALGCEVGRGEEGGGGVFGWKIVVLFHISFGKNGAVDCTIVKAGFCGEAMKSEFE